MAMPTVLLLKGPFTADDFERLASTGILREDDRVELINGQVVEMSPIGDRHAHCVRRLNWLLTDRLGRTARVDVQNPVVLGEHDVPQPDLIVLRPRPDANRNHPGPSDILLAVEVSDTGLDRDRDIKLPRYAQAGVREVWLVNLPEDQIEIHRAPAGDGYGIVEVKRQGQSLSPLFAPQLVVEVAEI